MVIWHCRSQLKNVENKTLQFLFFCIEEPKIADNFFSNFWFSAFVLEPYHFKYTYLHKKSRINEAWDSGTYRFHTTKKTAFWSLSYQNAYISYNNNNHVKLKLGLWHMKAYLLVLVL